MRRCPDTFSLAQRVLHWTMVVLILFNLLLPQAMGGRGPDLGVVPPVWLHIAAGSAVLGLAVIRLALRLTCGVPPEPRAAPWVFRVLARSGQWVFYLLFFAMPITGLLTYYHGLAWAQVLHAEVLRPLFWLLITVHVGLALAHQFYWKTDMLGKVIRG